MFPTEHITGEGFVYKFFLQEQFKDTSTEKLRHVLKTPEREIEKSTLRIEPTLQYNCVEVWIPPQNIPKCLMCDYQSGVQGPACSLIVKLANDGINQT